MQTFYLGIKRWLSAKGILDFINIVIRFECAEVARCLFPYHAVTLYAKIHLRETQKTAVLLYGHRIQKRRQYMRPYYKNVLR